MKPRSYRALTAATLGAVGAATACASLLGIDDVAYVDAADAAGAEAGPDKDGDGGDQDAAHDAASCDANLTNDRRNCGRCGHECAQEHGSAICVAGACVFKCDALFGHCDTSNDGCTYDLRSDTKHCGSCDHDCQGDPCEAGMCPARTLASGQHGPRYVAVDDDAVYWANTGTSSMLFGDGDVRRMAKDGGAPAVIVSGNNAARPTGIGVDGTSVYWTNFGASLTAGSVSKSAKDGGSMALLATAQTGAGCIGLDATRVYWAIEGDPGSLHASIKDGGGDAAPLAQGLRRPGCFDMTGDDVYLAITGTAPSDGQILRVPLDGGVPVRFAVAQAPLRTAVAGSIVYWTNSQPVEAGSVAGLREDGSDAGAPLASLLASPAQIVADGPYVYWSDAIAGTIVRARTDGSEVIVLAKQQVSPHGLAVDARYVYWASSGTYVANGIFGDWFNLGDGAIGRVAK